MPHGIHRRSPSVGGQPAINTRSATNSLKHQPLLPRGSRQPVLRPGVAPPQRQQRTANNNNSTTNSNAGRPAVVASPSPAPVANTTLPQRSSVATSAMWGSSTAGASVGSSSSSFTSSSGSSSAGFAATKLQQQQYVRHVQQDLPGGSQKQSQQEQQAAWPSQWQPAQVEARNRGNKGQQPTGQEPVFSYQQLFSQEMTPTAAGASKARSNGTLSSSSSKGFAKNGGKGSSRSKSGSSNGKPGGSRGVEATPGVAHVRLCITHATEFGQSLRVTGSGEQLGAWDCFQGPKLSWHEGHKWSADVTLPPGSYEFKYLLEHRSGYLEWEGGGNRTFTVPKTAAEIAVEGRWGATEDTEVLELQQQPSYRQQIQALQQQDSVDEAAAAAAQRDQEATARAEEAAFAAANAAAAAAYKQQAEAAAVPEAAPLAVAANNSVPLSDLFTFDLSVLDSDVPGHQQLMQVLLTFRHDMVEGLSGVTYAMQEIQDELSQVQTHMSRLAAERMLEGAMTAGDLSAAAGGADGDEAAAGGRAVVGSQGGLTAATAAIIAADAAVSQEQALSGLQGVVQTWQHELVSFKQESLDLRHEIETLRVSLEGQMSDNTAAVQHLESLVKQLMGLEGGAALPPSATGSIPPRATATVAAAAVAPPPPSTAAGRQQGGTGSGPPGSSELLDDEDKMLLDRINHLASDLSAEMKEAVQELEQQQQSLLERHQHIIADMSLNSPGSSSSSSMDRLSLDFGFGPVGAAAAGLGGMLRMQPTNNRTPNQQRQQQQVPAAAPHVMRAIVGWLESREVEKYHRGLLLAVMVSSGLWQDSMWKQLEGGEAFRATYKAYKAIWSDACLQTWKDNITTKQALLLSLSTGRQQLLSMHILWSLQELSANCSALHQLLADVATPIELGLMRKLREKGGAGQGWALGVTGAPVGGGEAAAAAQCAVLLQRWLAAAADQGRW